MSESTKPTKKKTPDTTASDAVAMTERVAAYLADNPDFFVDRQELLSTLTPPHRWTGDGIVDLQKTMLDHLRGEVETLKNGAVTLIENSRSNMSTQTQVHGAVLALLQADGLEQVVHAVSDELPMLLDVDVVTLAFESVPGRIPVPAIPGTRVLNPGTVDRILGAEKNVLLLGDTRDDGTLFGEGAGLVRSSALVRLRRDVPVSNGLLALGARGTAFHPGQGTELLTFLAHVTESCVNRWLAETT